MRKLTTLLLLIALSLTIFPTSVIHAYADDSSSNSTIQTLTINEKTLVTLSQGETKVFEVTIPDNKFYVAETSKYSSTTIDTYMSISNFSSGTIADNDSGKDVYSMICFSNQKDRTLTISVSINDSSVSGNFYLQVRKQQAVYYGFDYGELNTLPDLTTPYNSFSSLYDSYMYQNQRSTHFADDDERGYQRFNSEIVFFAGHGAKGLSGGNYGHSMDFYNGSALAVFAIHDMSNVKVAVWAACYSANSNNTSGISFIGTSVNHGAKCSLGFPDTVPSESSRTLTNNMFTRLAEGYTIQNSAQYGALHILWPWDNAKDFMIAGDTNTRLTTVNYTKTSSNNEQIATANNYNDLISNYDYVTYDNDTTIRYYVTINGIITNQFVDMPKDKNSQVYTLQNYTINREVAVLPILLKYDTTNTATKENHLVYIVENNVATPVLITHITVTEKDGATYVKTICRNLNDGSYIDYAKINSVKEREYD